MLNEEKRDMIRGIEDLSQTSVKEVMIPRIDVDFISIDIPEAELLEKGLKGAAAQWMIVSKAVVQESAERSVKVVKAAGTKCPRCWNYSETPDENGLCPRCHAVMSR